MCNSQGSTRPQSRAGNSTWNFPVSGKGSNCCDPEHTLEGSWNWKQSQVLNTGTAMGMLISNSFSEVIYLFLFNVRSSIYWLVPKMATLGQHKARSYTSEFYGCGRSPFSWTIFHCLSMHISVMSYPEPSSQDWKQHSSTEWQHCKPCLCWSRLPT